MEDCIRDRCKKTCDMHTDQVAGIAVLNDRVSYAWKITNLLILLGMAVIGYTHVKGATFENHLTEKTAKIETEVAKIEERINGLKGTISNNHAELVRRLRDLDKATAAMARTHGGGTTQLLAKDL